ncbi:hypothetical protein HY310_03415, partial [Candidatus Microgenomates bacterium]|nr:hypothetical protein [Candidatus Microgenomates bacterium]
MEDHIPERLYPLTFRKEESEKLGQYVKQRRSVNLIGMRRVGIGNFLRFFLHHNDIVSTYISTEQKHLFVAVDLDDLVERELYPFWTLTLKRLVDVCETADLPDETKEKINTLFLASIQSQDLFLVIDTLRKALTIIVSHNLYPTLFFIRFDRLQNAFNTSFFDNLEGLYHASHENLSYVFTSYRSLDSIFPTAKTTLSVFAQQMYIRPATEIDMLSVYEVYRDRYQISLSKNIEESLFNLVNGNLQYLQLALILLTEHKEQSITTEKALFELLILDERINLESEELWESLTKEEKRVLLHVAKKQHISAEEKLHTIYLWETGIITDTQGYSRIFSPLLEGYLVHLELE